MATDLNSINVVAGDDILASEYNTLRADLVRRAGDYETSGGSSNAFTLSIDSSIVTSYVDGSVFKFKASFSITGTCTLNVNTIGAKTIVDPEGLELLSGEITSGDLVTVQYDSSSDVFVLLAPSKNRKNLRGFHVGSSRYSTAVGACLAGVSSIVGFSDASTPLICVGTSNNDSTLNGCMGSVIKVSEEHGVDLYLFEQETDTDYNNILGAVEIGTDFWHVRATNIVRKNSSSVTFGSDDCQGPLAHDPASSYLLFLTSTTNVRRFSGIAGTTLTFVDNVTLASAIDTDKGFLYDNTNARYIGINASANEIRRYDSSGTLVDAVSYSIGDTFVKGIVFIKNRVYLVVIQSGGITGTVSEPSHCHVEAQFIPTQMTR